MRWRLIALVCVLVLVAGALRWKPQPQSSGSEVLLKLEFDFQKAAAEHGLDGFMSYYAEDATELPNGGPIVSGKESIREALGPWSPDMRLTWTPVKAEMAASGDLGYTYGRFVLEEKDKQGNPARHYGKYTTIWKKQKDGTWKVAVDMGNAGTEPK